MVYHIMKDGTKLTDITGKVIKVSEADSLYEVMKQIHKRRQREERKRERG